MICQAKAGLLVLRECGQPAAGACSTCAKPLCAEHLGSGQCATCALTGGGARDRYADEEASRAEYYRDYGEGAQYGKAGFFSGRDAQSLSRPGGPPPVPRQYDPHET